MFTIGINFFQNIGIVTEIPISWPESFKLLFTWLEISSMDFSVFGGAQLGVWTSIWTGLLVPIWLIWMFDATWRMEFGNVYVEDKRGAAWCSFVSTSFVALAVAGIAANCYESDALDALFLVLSVLYIFEWII